MKQTRKISRKVISIVLSLLMVFSCFSGMCLTAFAAPTETLLTKITPTGIDTYSESVPGVVTVTLSNISRYNGSWAYGGTVTVAPKDGYTITKCIFDARKGAVEDTEAPFSIDVGSATYVNSVEVYGYQAATNNIIINSAEHGSVTADPATAASGETVTLTAHPDAGYKLKSISAYKFTSTVSDSFPHDGTTKNNYTGTYFNLYIGDSSEPYNGWCVSSRSEAYITISSNSTSTIIDSVELTAERANWIYGNITANVGTVTKNGATITINNINTTSVTIKSDTTTSTYFKSATVKGKVLNGDNPELSLTSTDNPNVYTFTMPDSNVCVSAEFEEGVDKTALNDAITAAETLYDSIKDNTDYTDIANTLKSAIDAAKEVADNEEADQDAVDTANGAISDATTAAVVGMINALPTSTEVTTSDKDKIEKVRAAYDNLTDAQKESVDTETLKKLTDAETALQDAIDTETAQAATDTINSLPAAEDVTTANKDAIEAARKAYNDLTDDQKKKVSDDTLKKLTDAEDALKAATVSDEINALPAADDVTTSDKAAIEAARAAYDALTDAQKAYVSADTLKKLTDAEDALAAAEVAEEIDVLPETDEVTTSDKEAIEKAREAYDALTDEQKAYVPAETLKKLTDDEDALAAAEVTEEINALPDANAVTIDDKDAIEKARAAYDALTDEQKAFVSDETLEKLTDAEETLFNKEIIDAVEKITNLPNASKVKTSDKDAIEAARKAYDSLTDEQKEYVSAKTVKKLTDAENALAPALVNDMINALPAASDVTTADKDAIEKARAAYDALTDEQKENVSADTLKKLTDAEDALAAATVSEAINALPAADDVTANDKDAIEVARAAYDALTDEQKANVSDETLKKLTDDEAALKHIIEAEVAAVEDAITALPEADEVTTADKDAIEAAKAAYDALTDEQKEKVDSDALQKLTDAEDALEAAEVEEAINELPAAEDVTTDDEEDIKAAKAAYDALTDEQKEKVDNDALQKLTDAEDALEAAEVEEAINELPAAEDVTADDEEEIKEARAAYDALTDEQKAYVSDEALDKLEAAEEALNALLKDGWVKENGKWYYYKKGEKTKWYQTIDGKKYYFNSNGEMVTGWVKFNSTGKWHYFKADGSEATGWYKVGSKWYYSNTAGEMQTGWIKDGAKWYYLSSSGAMVTGWQKIGGKWYYFHESGSMRTADLTYKGKVYHFNSSGACTNP